MHSRRLSQALKKIRRRRRLQQPLKRTPLIQARTPPANTTPDESRASSPHVIDPTDPFKTGAGEESNYNQYQSQLDSSRQNADALRDAVEKGNFEVAVQLDKVAEMLRRLAVKPADRRVNSEIVINTLRTHQTLSEFKEMLDEVLKNEEQVSI